MALSRETMLGGANRRRVHKFQLEYPTQSGEVVTEDAYVRSLSASELGEVHHEQDRDKTGKYNRCVWVVYCLCNASGNPVFNKSDIRLVSDLDACVITTIYTEALKHNSSMSPVEKKDDATA